MSLSVAYLFKVVVFNPWETLLIRNRIVITSVSELITIFFPYFKQKLDDCLTKVFKNCIYSKESTQCSRVSQRINLCKNCKTNAFLVPVFDFANYVSIFLLLLKLSIFSLLYLEGFIFNLSVLNC